MMTKHARKGYRVMMTYISVCTHKLTATSRDMGFMTKLCHTRLNSRHSREKGMQDESSMPIFIKRRHSRRKDCSKDKRHEA